MSERYIIKDRWIFDTKLNKNIHSIDCYEEKSILDIMNSQDQRIAELEEQLKKSRVKYFIGFDSDFNVAVKELDLNIVLPNWMYDKEFKFYDTKEEAQAKLQELKGE